MNIQNFFVGDPAQNPNGLQLLASTTLTGATHTLTVSSRKLYLVLVQLSGKGGADTIRMRFNGDTANNYAARYSTNGAADTTNVSQSGATIGPISGTVAQLITAWVSNLTGTGAHKHITFITSGETINPTQIPNRTEGAAYWDLADDITSITIYTTGGATMGGTVYVYGVSI